MSKMQSQPRTPTNKHAHTYTHKCYPRKHILRVGLKMDRNTLVSKRLSLNFWTANKWSVFARACVPTSRHSFLFSFSFIERNATTCIHTQGIRTRVSAHSTHIDSWACIHFVRMEVKALPVQQEGSILQKRPRRRLPDQNSSRNQRMTVPSWWLKRC